jgi:hypothetical protein
VVDPEGNFHGIVRLLVVAFSAFQRFSVSAFQLFSFQLFLVAGLYFAGDYNLRGRTPKADVDVCFNGNIAVSQVKLL